MILYMYIAPGQRMTQPWGRKFDVNRNILSLRSFFASFNKISLKSYFIHFFLHNFIHVYSPGSGKDASRGQSFDVNRNVLSIHSFVVNILLKSDFIRFFMIYYMYIVPGQVGGWGWGGGERGIIQPPWNKVLMSTETSCHFGHLLLVSNHRQ